MAFHSTTGARNRPPYTQLTDHFNHTPTKYCRRFHFPHRILFPFYALLSYSSPLFRQFNSLNTKRRQLYLKTQFVQRRLLYLKTQFVPRRPLYLKTQFVQRRPLYLKTQFVQRCKHFSSRLKKPISLCCK